jgi:NitT/TauT family transport system permease protein
MYVSKWKRAKLDIDDIANIVLFLAAFVGIWQLVFILGIWPKVSLPSPMMVATTAVELISNLSLITGIGMTLLRLLVGFSISMGIGTVVGLAMVKFKGFGKTMGSFAVGFQTFPSVAWIPFAILLIGFDDFGILFVVVMSSIFSVMSTTYSGIRNVPTIYIEAGKNMGAKGFSLFKNIMIPAATPSLIMGMRQSWSFAWHALIAAEMLITTLIGLGYLLSVGRELQIMSQVITAMIAIFAIGLLSDRFVFLKLEEKVRAKWGLSQNG